MEPRLSPVSDKNDLEIEYDRCLVREESIVVVVVASAAHTPRALLVLFAKLMHGGGWRMLWFQIDVSGLSSRLTVSGPAAPVVELGQSHDRVNAAVSAFFCPWPAIPALSCAHTHFAPTQAMATVSRAATSEQVLRSSVVPVHVQSRCLKVGELALRVELLLGQRTMYDLSLKRNCTKAK